MEEESFSTEEIAANLKRISRQQEALSRKIRRHGANPRLDTESVDVTADLAVLQSLDQEAALWLKRASEITRRR